MNEWQRFKDLGEYGAAGLYEEPERSLFYRKGLGLRRYYENCPLAEYRGEELYPCGVLPRNTLVSPHYMTGLSMNYRAFCEKDKELADTFLSEFCRFHSTVPHEHTVAGNMYTHSFPHYERIAGEGLDSYLPRIEKIEDRDLREGLLHLVAGIRTYRDRCVSYLTSVGASARLISALTQVPFQPARDIYEALVCWNFVFYLDSCDNPGCLASGLYPYYRGEDITELLKCFYDNVEKNDAYSMSLSTDYNPLTLQCLEASKGKCRPMIELFVNENTPDEIWEKAFEVVRTGNGQPAFYNETVLLPGLKKRFPGIREEDLRQYCGGGCTESMLTGLSNVDSLAAGINLLLILEKVMYDKLAVAKDFEEFYGYYREAVSEVVDRVTTEIANSQKNRALLNPVPMRTLLVDDCIDNGKDFNNGGARYLWSVVSFAGSINVIDSLLVIRDTVFGGERMDPEEFLSHLRENDKDFLARMRKHEVCFGRDNEDANRMANRVSTDCFSLLDDKKTYFGFGFLPATILFRYAAWGGKGIGATPDGREAGAPLCDSLAAIFGKDTNGPTALLRSTASLNLERALGTPVLNFNIKPDFKNEVLKSLIKGYMKLGGIQIQITCTSAEELLDAYEHPDLHRNLIVRVGGYSDYFCRLSDDMKRLIINRTIQQSV